MSCVVAVKACQRFAPGGVKPDLEADDGAIAASARRHVMSEFEHSTPTVHRGLDAKMVPFGGWRCRCRIPSDHDEHLACRTIQSSDVAPRHRAP